MALKREVVQGAPPPNSFWFKLAGMSFFIKLVIVITIVWSLHLAAKAAQGDQAPETAKPAAAEKSPAGK